MSVTTPPLPASAAFVVDTSLSPHAVLRPVPHTAVRLTDAFWEPRRQANRAATLPSQFRHIEETHRLDNFRRAAGKKEGQFVGIYFNDSDVYKWLEAASSALATDDDPELRRMVDIAIAEIAAAQEPNGYLNTYFTFERAGERYTNLRDMHELYCAGHLIQAAVAHHRASGESSLLDVARRVADNLCDTFGPEAQGKRPGTDGHPEIEMALVELYRVTGERRYLHQAAYFVDARGREPSACYNGKKPEETVRGTRYHQDHVPYRDLDEVTGHAVRMLYLACGAADLCLETEDAGLRAALDRQWDNMTTRRMYVSGGLGARWEGEAFGKDYELPNERAYTETCAAIASVMWNHRMLALTGEARYSDLLEWTLYNAVLPGISRDGQSYFYQNPLADDGSHRRQPWFGCACCPPNVARLFAQLPGYFYSVSDEGVWAHLYAAGSAEVTLSDGRTVALTTRTEYPWDGDIAITVAGEGTFSVFLRVPAWCEAGAVLEVSGEPFSAPLTPGSYVEVRREWKAGGETLRLHLPMPVRLIESHPNVLENAGRVAVARGPLLYCVEQEDCPGGVPPRDLVLTPSGGELRLDQRPDLLGGVVALMGTGRAANSADGWQDRLYRTCGEAASVPASGVAEAAITAIPYYAWANRAPGAMQVWLRKAS
jgi:hypothetical protein